MANLLPFDIIFDIFQRLPVKSLVRFKCVCKSWYDLIESWDFIKSYRNRSLGTNSNSFLIFTPKHSGKSDSELAQCLWSCRISGRHLFSQDSLATKLYLPPPFIGDGFFEVVGSCNGLICIRNSFCLALMNPSTRMFKFVPYFGNRSTHWYGFGYDSRSDDYKIVAIAGWGFVVYSLGTGLWGGPRCLGKFPSIDEANGFLFNGRLHWTSACRRLLRTFDLHYEEWSEFSLPNCGHADDLWWVDLGIFDGCLCVIFSIMPSSYSSHLWVMKEYGVKETWTKLFTLPFVKAMPLANTKKRCEVLFSRGLTQGLVLWNTEEKTLTEIEAPIEHFSQVTACRDSLAPLAHSLVLRGKETKKAKRHHKKEENQMKQDRSKKKQRYMTSVTKLLKAQRHQKRHLI